MRTALVFALSFCLVGCAAQNQTAGSTPAPPTPPQVTVANSMLALAHAVNGATDALISCRQQAKCSAEDVTAAENVLSAVANAGKSVNAELTSPDAWSVQKNKILAIVGQSGIAQLKAKVSPATQLLIASVVTVFDNISLAVGGPTF